jgi:hypothetical protein
MFLVVLRFGNRDVDSFCSSSIDVCCPYNGCWYCGGLNPKPQTTSALELELGKTRLRGCGCGSDVLCPLLCTFTYSNDLVEPLLVVDFI